MTMHFRFADLAVYAAHCGFWGAFVIARLASRQANQSEPDGPVSQEKRTANYSRLLVGIHFAAFAVMYTGIGAAVFSGRVPDWFAGQRLAGAAMIGLGAALAVSAVLYFRSWRFRASVSEGHQLATGGPFAV